ncbi:MAG: MBL fold metallo-hydrolase [Erysipelotrichaceae bacterium]|nr:MBL fold metallo-hydrolase [Erysipelotrichaceae bacterium]
MEIIKLTVGLFQTNCYILIKEDTALIVDPGASARKIASILEQHPECTKKAVLLTHGHLDHIGAVDALYKKYGLDVWCSRDDEKLLTDEKFNSLAGISVTVNCPVKWIDSPELQIGAFDIKVYFTPGHTSGSVMYLIEGILFSGDTLFRESVGRTDLYSGSNHQLMESLKVLNQFDPSTRVLPGHEDETTIGHELSYNPFLY